jgi:hypothetical protein
MLIKIIKYHSFLNFIKNRKELKNDSLNWLF